MRRVPFASLLPRKKEGRSPPGLALYATVAVARCNLVLERNDADGLWLVDSLPVGGIRKLRIGRERTRDVSLGPLHTARVQDEHTAVDEVVLARQRVAVGLGERHSAHAVAVAEGDRAGAEDVRRRLSGSGI